MLFLALNYSVHLSIDVHCSNEAKKNTLEQSVRMTKNRELSREEEAELSRSKKKVKEGYHADFNDGISESGQSQGGQNYWGAAKKSFKEKLMGEFPGVYTKAFEFS